MANEKRLIDPNAFWNLLQQVVYDVFTVHEHDGKLNGTASVGYYTETIQEVLKQTPTVDAVEVVRGRWEKQDWKGVSIKGFMACSNCNVMIPTADNNRYCLRKLNYCPNCGAKMRGSEE
jgi:hypothetical protein